MKNAAVVVVALFALVALCVSPAPATGQSPTWQLGPSLAFEYQRHDGVFVPGPEGEPWANKVYFLGGRTSASTESPNIWMFDPVAGTYADTGADVYEDVSNYNGNLLLADGTGRGPAIYVVGGTDKDHGGSNIALVQRYYPQTNQAEYLGTEDNWPGKVGGYVVGGMGSAVVDDMIYVFGGWETNAAPYFSTETWVFDPKGFAGYRWTNLPGVALSVGRSYIQTAVQGGKIYAMGGTSGYVGGDLVPTDVVEVLDPAAWWDGWAALAPMPVPTAEGRGFGFEYDTKGAQTPWDGKLYVVAGGDWPDISAEAMEYDIASNTWNQGFPDLNEPRVNLAGTFIPLCTDNPDDGLPGMWVFGGRSYAGCDPPFGAAEYYPMQCEVVPFELWMPLVQMDYGAP